MVIFLNYHNAYDVIKMATLHRTLCDVVWRHKDVCTDPHCITGGPPGVLGIWGEGLFIFRELGSTANYFRGAGEQAHTFADLGSTAKK